MLKNKHKNPRLPPHLNLPTLATTKDRAPSQSIETWQSFCASVQAIEKLHQQQDASSRHFEILQRHSKSDPIMSPQKSICTKRSNNFQFSTWKSVETWLEVRPRQRASNLSPPKATEHWPTANALTPYRSSNLWKPFYTSMQAIAKLQREQGASNARFKILQTSAHQVRPFHPNK